MHQKKSWGKCAPWLDKLYKKRREVDTSERNQESNLSAGQGWRRHAANHVAGVSWGLLLCNAINTWENNTLEIDPWHSHPPHYIANKPSASVCRLPVRDISLHFRLVRTFDKRLNSQREKRFGWSWELFMHMTFAQWWSCRWYLTVPRSQVWNNLRSYSPPSTSDEILSTSDQFFVVQFCSNLFEWGRHSLLGIVRSQRTKRENKTCKSMLWSQHTVKPTWHWHV